ncbi:Porin-like protein NicP precursor [compost metagenome]
MKLPAHLTAAPTALALAIAACSTPASAAFFEDSKASLELRNIYLNRDFREGAGQSKRDEWAQGFLLRYQSGYTEGPVGFGVDALGLLGVKLDSSPDRVDTGLLPTHDDGRAADEFSHLGLTGKVRVSKTELKIGTHIPVLPVLKPNDGRILPQTFDGVMLTSRDLGKLALTAGHLSEVTQRNSSNREELQLNNKNRRFAGTAEADYFNVVGVQAPLTDALGLTLFSAELDDIYRQHFVGLNYSQPLGEGTFKADVRLFLSDDYGRSAGGEIDNRAFNGMLSYSQSGHTLGLGWQDMAGDTGFAYVNGTDPYLVNFSQINDFANPDERSWQARYDYDFAAAGIPGLSFMTRYVRGTDATVIGSTETGKEWERNSEIRYVFQSGALKNLSLRYRNASYRSSFARDADENRIIIGYTIPLL